MEIVYIGMVWYRSEDYAAIRNLMLDADRLPATYAEWLRNAEKGEKEVRSKGQIPIKAYIDPKDFGAWCAIRGLKVDAGGRQQFAALAAAQEARKAQGTG